MQKNLVFPEPLPPMTRIFLFLAYFGCLGQLAMVRRSVIVMGDVLKVIRVYVRGNVRSIAPPGAAVFHPVPVLLLILPPDRHGQPKGHPRSNAPEDIHRPNTGQGIGEGSRKALRQMQHPGRKIVSGRQTKGLGCLAAQVGEQDIGNIGN